MDFRTIFHPNPGCPVREIGGGLVIMAPDGETTHSLEDLGAFIYKRLDGKRDLEDVLAAILEEYQVDEDQAREDLASFMAQLVEAGLVVAPGN